MFGAESDTLERQRQARQAAYAAELQRQIDERESKFPLRDPSPTSSQISNQKPQYNLQQTTRLAPTWKEPEIMPSVPAIPKQMYNQPSYRDYPETSRPTNDNKLSSQLKSLQYTVDRMLTVEIPMRIKPTEDAVSTLNSKFESFSHSNREGIQALREKITELSYNYNSINQKANDSNERLRAAFSDLKSDVSRTKDINETKISAYDSRLAQIEENIRALTTKQQQLEQAITDQFAQINSAISNVQKNSQQADQHLMSQLESLNRQTISTFAQVNQAMTSSTISLTESITSLAKEAREGFSTIRDEMDEGIDLVQKQMEQNNAEINQSFSTLQSEVVQTFSSFRNVLDSDFASCEQAIATEAAIRKENDQKIVDSLRTMNTQITGVSNTINTRIDKVESEIPHAAEAVCITYVSKWKNDLNSFLKEVSTSVSEVQTRIGNNEQKFTDLVTLVNKNQEEIFDILKANIDTTIRQNMETIDKRILQTERSVTQADHELALFKQEMSQTKQEMMQARQELNDAKKLDPRVEKLERKHKKSKSTVLVSINPRIEKLEESIQSMPKEILTNIENKEKETKAMTQDMQTKIDKLEKQSEQTTIQVKTIEENVETQKQKINLDIEKRVEKLEKTTVNNQNLTERVVRLETLQGKQKPSIVAVPVPVKKTPKKPKEEEKKLMLLEEEDEDDEEDEEESEEESEESKEEKEEEEEEESKSIRKLTYCSCEGVRIKEKDPKPGIFVLTIGEPAKRSSKGIKIAKPHKYDRFVYPPPDAADEKSLTPPKKSNKKPSPRSVTQKPKK